MIATPATLAHQVAYYVSGDVVCTENWPAIHAAIVKRAQEAIEAEREACAQAALAEDSFMMLQDFGMQSMCTQVRENVAVAIRARSNSV